MSCDSSDSCWESEVTLFHVVVVFACIFILWKVVVDVFIWRVCCMLSKNVCCSKCGISSFTRGLESKSCLLNIWSDEQKETIPLCENQQAGPLNISTWFGLLWRTGKHNKPLRDNQSESAVWTRRPSAAHCCQHCSVMQTGASINEVFTICLYTVRIRNLILQGSVRQKLFFFKWKWTEGSEWEKSAK